MPAKVTITADSLLSVTNSHWCHVEMNIAANQIHVAIPGFRFAQRIPVDYMGGGFIAPSPPPPGGQDHGPLSSHCSSIYDSVFA